MTETALKCLAAKLQGICFNGQSSVSLLSLVRIYSSLYDLVFVNALDSEYGDRETYRCKLGQLADILMQRCTQTDSAELEAYMLDSVYSAICSPGTFSGGRMDSRCRRMMDRLAREHMASHGPGSQAGHYGAMKLMLNLVYAMDRPACNIHPYLQFVRMEIASWAASMDANGWWNGITDREALHRLVIMDMNSYMMLDGSYDEEICRSYSCYCTYLHDELSRKRELTPYEMSDYALMYDMIRYGSLNDPNNSIYSGDIADRLERQAGCLPEGSDDWLLCQSIAVSSCCTRISYEVQMRMFEKIG